MCSCELAGGVRPSGRHPSWRGGPKHTHDSFVFRESSTGRLAAASRAERRLLGDGFGLTSLHQWLTPET
ncbi:unnamed protein product [Merluccius merluccius]